MYGVRCHITIKSKLMSETSLYYNQVRFARKFLHISYFKKSLLKDNKDAYTMEMRLSVTIHTSTSSAFIILIFNFLQNMNDL